MQDNFLGRFWSNLARKVSCSFSYKIVARILATCWKKSFIFSARLARYVQNITWELASLARKILARLGYFLQDGFNWVCLVSESSQIPTSVWVAFRWLHLPLTRRQLAVIHHTTGWWVGHRFSCFVWYVKVKIAPIDTISLFSVLM